MFAPFVMPGDFETTVPPNAQPPVGMDMGGMPSVMSQPHITFAGFIVAALFLKYFTESNILTTDVAEIKVSLLSIITATLLVDIGNSGLKVVTAFLLRRGIPLFGFADFIGAN